MIILIFIFKLLCVMSGGGGGAGGLAEGRYDSVEKVDLTQEQLDKQQQNNSLRGILELSKLRNDALKRFYELDKDFADMATSYVQDYYPDVYELGIESQETRERLGVRLVSPNLNINKDGLSPFDLLIQGNREPIIKELGTFVAGGAYS